MDEYAYHLVEEVRAGRLSRRQLLTRATVAGISLSSIPWLLSASSPAGAAGRRTGGGDWAGVSTSIPTDSVEPQRGGTLRLAGQVPAADPDPVTASESGSIATITPAVDYLCALRGFALEPSIATSWEAPESADTWTFVIRQGVLFHDGTMLTNNDVVATFERLVDPNVGSSAGSVFGGVLSPGNVEAVGDDMVRFHLDKAVADFPFLVSARAYQTAILPANYEVGTFSQGRIGTGPFILTEYVTGRSATYVRNPDYWRDGRPYMDGVELTFTASGAATILAMQAGDVDVLPEVPLTGAEAILRSDNFKLDRQPAADYRSLAMRVDVDPFQDKRIRQALAVCIDREALITSIFAEAGGAQVANDHSWAPVYPDSEQPNAEIPQRTRDIDLARSLLSDAGVSDGVSVTLTTETFGEMPQVATAIQQYCRPAGINIELDILSVDQYYGSGDNQPWLEVPLGMTDWASRGTAAQAIAPLFPCDGVWNSPHWCNADFDRLYAQYLGEVDVQERSRLALEMATIQHEEVPVVIPYWIDRLSATSSRVNGYVAGSSLNLVETWIS